MKIEEIAYDIVSEIIRDLTSRRGLRQEYDQIEDSIRKEIFETWESIVLKHIGDDVREPEFIPGEGGLYIVKDLLNHVFFGYGKDGNFYHFIDDYKLAKQNITHAWKISDKLIELNRGGQK